MAVIVPGAVPADMLTVFGDATPYTEYRGEMVLASDAHGYALASGDLQPAPAIGFEAAWEDSGRDWAAVPSEETITPPYRETVSVPLEVDPYESPLLEGFLQVDYHPEPVDFRSAEEVEASLHATKVPRKRGRPLKNPVQVEA